MSTRPGRPPRPRPASLRSGRAGAGHGHGRPERREGPGPADDARPDDRADDSLPDDRPGPVGADDGPGPVGADDGPGPVGADDRPGPEVPVEPGDGPRPSAAPGDSPRPRTAPVRRLSAPGSAPVPVVPARRPSVVSTGMVDRLAERDAMRRHRLRRRLALVSGAVVVAAALVWLAFFSPVLATDAGHVRVVGAGELVDAGQVDAIVAGAVGTPLPRLDTVALRDRLLAVRGVEDVAITREWPRGLEVRITPRDPVAAVPDDGRFALLDADATQIAEVDAPPSGVPVVDVPLDSSSRATLQAVLTVLAALPDDLAGEVTAASAQTQDTVTLTLDGGAGVVWGSAQDNALKTRVLEALRKAKQTKHATVYDVSAPNLPVTRGGS